MQLHIWQQGREDEDCEGSQGVEEGEEYPLKFKVLPRPLAELPNRPEPLKFPCLEGPLEVKNADVVESGRDCCTLYRFSSSHNCNTWNSSMVIGLERVRIEVLKGPYSGGKPFGV